MTKEFEKYKLACCKTCATDAYIAMCYVCPAMRERKIGWQAAIRHFLKELEIEESFEIFQARLKKELDGS